MSRSILVLVLLFFPAFGLSGCREQVKKNKDIKILWLGLHNYALRNSGVFPSGGANEVDSLALVNTGNGDPSEFASHIAGPQVAEQQVFGKIKKGIPLSLEDSTWRYREGLTIADDRGLVILWEKRDRHPGNARDPKETIVGFLGGGGRFVPDSEWPEFVANQELLMSKRTDREKKCLPVLSGTINFPSGSQSCKDGLAVTVVTQKVDGGSARSMDATIRNNQIHWYRLDEIVSGGYQKPCDVEILAYCEQKVAEPVVVHLEDGLVVPSDVVFVFEEE